MSVLETCPSFFLYALWLDEGSPCAQGAMRWRQERKEAKPSKVITYDQSLNVVSTSQFLFAWHSCNPSLIAILIESSLFTPSFQRWFCTKLFFVECLSILSHRGFCLWTLLDRHRQRAEDIISELFILIDRRFILLFLSLVFAEAMIHLRCRHAWMASCF